MLACHTEDHYLPPSLHDDAAWSVAWWWSQIRNACPATRLPVNTLAWKWNAVLPSVGQRATPRSWCDARIVQRIMSLTLHFAYRLNTPDKTRNRADNAAHIPVAATRPNSRSRIVTHARSTDVQDVVKPFGLVVHDVVPFAQTRADHRGGVRAILP